MTQNELTNKIIESVNKWIRTHSMVFLGDTIYYSLLYLLKNKFPIYKYLIKKTDEDF